MGTFAVQIAKWFGAELTAVCGRKNVDMVQSLSADRLIDYTRRFHQERATIRPDPRQRGEPFVTQVPRSCADFSQWSSIVTRDYLV